MRIVSDSACDKHELPGGSFAAVPLKIITDQQEYVDDASLDLPAMLTALRTYHGRSRTSCPNVQDWLTAFGGEEEIFAVTITSGLSGSHNAAMLAKAAHEERVPGCRVHVVDSLSTGPEMWLIIEKLQALIAQGLDFDGIKEAITAYQQRLHLLYSLESLHNLAQNGRVNKLLASAVGMLGIRIVGTASPQGTLAPLGKCRGENKALAALIQHMDELGYRGGPVRIAHCLNENAAAQLREKLLDAYPQASITLYPTGGLCSFYAEKGGLLVGFEA